MSRIWKQVERAELLYIVVWNNALDFDGHAVAPINLPVYTLWWAESLAW